MHALLIILIILLILLIALLVAAIAFLTLAAPQRVNKQDYLWLTRQPIAHRGFYSADQTIPENSLPAYARAVEEGYGIELDVELTADDVLVVFHDDSLERMTGCKKRLWDCTWAELQQLKLAGSDEKIPLFADVLKLVDGKAPLVVEIKSTNKLAKICSMTYDLLKDYHGPYCIESFNPMIVAWFKKHAPQVLRGQLSSRYKDEASVSAPLKLILENMLLNFLSRPQFIAYRYTDTNKWAFRYCRSRGALTVAWTPDSKEAYQRSIRDFDAIIFEHFIPGQGA